MPIKDKESALNEIRILASIQSPYIISYKESIFDENTNYLYLIMELAEKGDLSEIIKKNYKHIT